MADIYSAILDHLFLVYPFLVFNLLSFIIIHIIIETIMTKEVFPSVQCLGVFLTWGRSLEIKILNQSSNNFKSIHITLVASLIIGYTFIIIYIYIVQSIITIFWCCIFKSLAIWQPIMDSFYIFWFIYFSSVVAFSPFCDRC